MPPWISFGAMATSEAYRGVMSIDVAPANEVSCAALAQVFGAKGPAAECQCQRYRLARGESFRNAPVEERAHRLRAQTNCGDLQAATTTGLIARLDGEAVGWCAVAPRASHPGLVRNGSMAAWAGRDEDRSDPHVWAITCVFVRPGSRRREHEDPAREPDRQRAEEAAGRALPRLLGRDPRSQLVPPERAAREVGHLP